MTNYNTARINAFCSNDDNFVAVDYNDPRAVAQRAQDSKSRAAKGKRVAAKASKDEAAAAMIKVGDKVQVAHGCFREVVEIRGGLLIVASAGRNQMVQASKIIA